MASFSQEQITGTPTAHPAADDGLSVGELPNVLRRRGSIIAEPKPWALERATAVPLPTSQVQESSAPRFRPTEPPLVSVIVPAFNAERFLRRTLRFALSQTWQRLEVVVVDDGSTDSTSRIVEEAVRVDDRVRLFRQANRGVAAARNRAIAEARGSLLAPLDADDLWHPDYLAHQVAALDAGGPETALSYAWWISIDADDRIRSFARPIRVRDQRRVLREIVSRNFIGNASSAIMRRAAVEATGGYDASLQERGAHGCEDMALYIALAERWNFGVAMRHLVGYRRHAEGMSRDVERMLRSEELVLDDLYRRRPDLPQGWRVLSQARRGQRALEVALRRRDFASARRVLCEMAGHGAFCVGAALAYYTPWRVVRRLVFGFNNRRTGRPPIDEVWGLEPRPVAALSQRP